MKKIYNFFSLVLVLFVSAGLTPFVANAQVQEAGELHIQSNNDTVGLSLNIPAGAYYFTTGTYDVIDDVVDAKLTLKDNGGNVIAIADNNAGSDAIISDVALQGGTYTVEYIDKVGGNGAVRDFGINYFLVPIAIQNAGQPGNDDLADATELTLNTPVVDQSNAYATYDAFGGEGNLAGALSGEWTETSTANSVWYKFTATAASAHAVKFSNLINRDNSLQVAVYGGANTSFTDLSLITTAEFSADDSLSVFCLTEGTEYYVLVDGEGIDSASFDIELVTYEIPNTTLLLAALDTSVNGNGVSCPSDTIKYSFTAKLVNAADSTSIDPKFQAYIDFLNLSINPGTQSFDGVAEETFVGITEGTYDVTSTDVCGTEKSASITFVDTIPDPVSIILSDLKDADCLINGNGSVTVDVEGGIQYLSAPAYGANYSYNSDVTADFSTLANYPGSSVGAPNYTSLPIGLYKIFYEDACGTYDSVQFIIDNPEYNLVAVDSIGGANPNCAGSATGSLLLSATGGQLAGLDIEWFYSATNDTTALLTAVALVGEDNVLLDTISAGLYMAIVADACADSNAVNRDTVWMTLVDPVFNDVDVTIATVAPTTFDAIDGSATITRIDGSGLDSVKWTFNGNEVAAFENQLAITGLSQGTYKATYKDNCLDTTVVFQFNLFADLANDDVCNAITIAEGDSLNRFTNIGSTIQTGEENFLMPVDPDNGWSAENEVQSSVWFKFVAPASGSVTVDVKTIDFPFANQSFDPQVAVFAGACTDIAALQLLSANDNSVLSPGNNNNSFQTVSCLTAGTEYYILVDGFAGLGEQGYFSIAIEEQAVADVILTSTLSTIDCNNPSASLEVDKLTGVGVGDITIVFDGDTLVFTGATETVTGIAPGTYELVAYDDCGIADSKTIEVEGFENRPFVIDFTLNSPTCPMGNDGSVDFTFDGGASVADYTFSVETSAGASIISNVSVGLTYSLMNLEAGEYSATLNDQCNNEKEFVFVLEDPTLDNVAISFDVTQPECNGATGDVAATLTGGSGIFYYNYGMDINNLDNGTSTRDTTGFDLTGLAAGTYYVFIRDYCIGDVIGNDTTLIDSFEVVDPNLDAVTIAVTKNNPTANGLSDGGFSYAISGGKLPYTATVYYFTNNVKGDTIPAVANEVSDLPAGSYRIEYKDDCAAGLTATTVVLLDPPANDILCNAVELTLGVSKTGDNSAATLTAVDADVTAPENNASCFEAGSWCGNDAITAPLWYTFEVPASGSVIVEVESGVFDPQLAVYSGTDCADGTSFTLLGASDDLSSTNDDSRVTVSCLTPGATIYVLVDVNETPVANVRGQFTVTASNNNNGSLKVFDIIGNASNNVSADGTIDLDIIGGAAPYTIVWADNDKAPEDRTGLAMGDYTVTVTDACGIVVTKTLTVGFNERENDRVCNATALLLNTNVTVSTEGANATVGEVSPSTNGSCTASENFAWCGDDGVDNSVWYTFVAPANGEVTIDMCGGTNTFDTQLAVYEATDCADFSTFDLIAANDDQDATTNCSKLVLTGLTSCTTYYVQVDSKGATGEASMAITTTSTNDAGADATSTVCIYDNAFDISTLVEAGIVTTGEFVDVDNTGALTGSIFDLASLNATAGTEYTFNYLVGSKCNGEYVEVSTAVFTITADNCVGVTETTNTVAVVYPNPASKEVFVKNANADVVYILTVDGKEVARKNNASNVRFDVSNLASGVYTVVAGSDKIRLVIQ
jgi:hypothetical protein